VIAVNSLRLRLLVGAAIWIVLALAVAGTLLAALFRGHVERRLEAELATQLEQIAAALERPGAGSLILTHQPSDPRLRKPYSGFYWQVDGAEGPVFRSRSLWDVALRLPTETSPDGKVHRHRITGPQGQQLIALERTVTLADAPGAYRVVAATDETELTAAAAAVSSVSSKGESSASRVRSRRRPSRSSRLSMPCSNATKRSSREAVPRPAISRTA